MFKVKNKIIIVDDRQDELDTLSRAFLDNGIGCRPLLYDNAYFEPLDNIRIAFFDLNIGEKKVDDSGKTPEEVENLNSGVYNDLAVAINQYIAKDNGPFALIFWTKNKKIIDGFIKYMQNPERGFSESPFPIVIDCIDKDEFINANNENNLPKKLLEVLNLEEIRFFFNFEAKAIEAAEKTINKLYEIIPKDEKWGENNILFSNLGNILSKIASSTLGFDHSKENPNKAVYEGLLPILNSEIINSENEVEWRNLLNSLFSASSQSELISPDDVIQRKVNSIFHLDVSTNFNQSTRGAVFEFMIFPNSKDLIANTFYYSELEKKANELFGTFISFNENADGSIKNEIRRKSKFIVIESSAACDYSQNKKRNNKYLFGLLTPVFDRNILYISKIRDSIFFKDLPHFHLNNENFCLWIDFNFVFSDFVVNENIGNPMFLLKKEIMDLIGNRYANHVSRIGITSF